MSALTDKEFDMIRDYIKQNYGISLNDGKKSLIDSRLRITVKEGGFENFTQYFNYLTSDKTGKSVVKFIDKITTNHTFFMREANHFDFLKDHTLPYIEEKYSNKKDLRLWCAGCSSGEEAYTLQMIVQQYFENKPGWNTEILATDISTSILTKAVNGIYKSKDLEPLPKEWKAKYFKPYDSENKIVSQELKDHITFRKLNLMDDRFKFKNKFQVIFCRNVMIYFDNDTRENLLRKFYDVIENDGYLFIGHSETLNQLNVGFKYIRPAVYRKC